MLPEDDLTITLTGGDSRIDELRYNFVFFTNPKHNFQSKLLK